ncbi:choice-of-anchor E domain-containing protein [Scytonema sp. UIC 10036]|uniref:choice-of-anchor E domain-containing protein n=1 Tax=Scytonema sp. UIC 10036 TaxID=2304196 RepID=UPI0012DAA3F5|nr:choice-of-anchor E domain-containing protein [Scytonema sp. UIC 10036]MUG97544.1 choice-of-anchor E domain-containing protein [Scytonema sp. UIC 10036]
MNREFLPRKFFPFLTAAIALTGIFAKAEFANAAILEYKAEYKPSVDEAAPYAGYGFTDIIKSPLSIKKFNSALGMLKSVTIEFLGDIKGDAGFENKSATPSTVTVDLSGLLQLQLPDNTSVFELNPQKKYSYNVAKYDCVFDYDGASGKTLEGLTATLADTKTYTDSSLLKFFSGLGNTDLLFTAKAQSSVSGSGNVASYVATYAKASVKVAYNYEERRRVAEPSNFIGLSLVVVTGLLAKRRLSCI